MEFVASNIAGLIVLFNPDESVLDNILSYLDGINILYVVDNSEPNFNSIVNEIRSLEKIKYISNNGNQGIANALNVGAAQAIQDKYKWLLTMDQDSSFNPTALTKYFQCASSLSDLELIAIIAPNFLAKPIEKITCRYTEVLTVITSGNLLNLHLHKAIGGFNEKLFIDEVDHDYCLKANLAHYKIIKFDDIYLNHQIGNARKFNLGLNSLHATVHSPIRHYYITRNCLYIFFTYRKKFPAYIYYRLWKVTRTLLFVMIFGSEKMTRLKYIALGFLHYFRSKMGRYDL